MQNTIANKIATLLNSKSVTFANIAYSTEVKTAAKYKSEVAIEKHTVANVQLFSNIKQATAVFANAVKKNANTANFVTSENYFEHTHCYSIVKHKTRNMLYLYAIYNNTVKSEYTINGQPATKGAVACYLTPSAAEKLLNPTKVTHNVTNNVSHSVVVRTIALCNIKSVTANKQTITF